MLLPIADGRALRTTIGHLIARHRLELAAVVVLQVLAALAGLAGPLIIGRLIDAMTRGAADAATVDLALVILVTTVVVQAILTRFAQLTSLRLGETVFARLRERFLESVLALPLSTVEIAGTGDLLSRTTSDIDSVAQIVRFGVPRLLITGVTAILTALAAALVNPLLALVLLAGSPLLWAGTRWYMKRSKAGYRRQLASYGRLVGVVGETVEGASTIDALDLAAAQRRKIDEALRERRNAEWYTLGLRSVWYPVTTLGLLLPVVLVLLVGGIMIGGGLATAGQVAAIALYSMQLAGPVEELVTWMDRIQVGTTALARIVGVEQVPADREPGDARPQSDRLVAEDVRFSYRDGTEVLHGVDLAPTPGERIAIVGPSGSGKSTFGRLLTGIAAPTSGRVTLGGVELTRLPIPELRERVALVTQEQHVFVGTLADNLRLAAPQALETELIEALRVVGAAGWLRALPQGLNTRVGSGGVVLTPAQAQQVALARLVLLDPQTLVLDEATSLIDPRAARGLERALDRVLEGRTVIAIAHRLHTARDADRVVVMRDGRITEAGSHDELVALGGEYAGLWNAWHGTAGEPPTH